MFSCCCKNRRHKKNLQKNLLITYLTCPHCNTQFKTSLDKELHVRKCIYRPLDNMMFIT